MKFVRVTFKEPSVSSKKGVQLITYTNHTANVHADYSGGGAQFESEGLSIQQSEVIYDVPVSGFASRIKADWLIADPVLKGDVKIEGAPSRETRGMVDVFIIRGNRVEGVS